MQNKKLDKSLLPKPQHPLGWKRGQLQISTSTANQLGNQQNTIDEARTRKNSQSSHPFSNKNQQQSITPQHNQHRQSFNNVNRQSYDSHGLKQQMTPSQYSLQQKQLLTFAANQSSQRINFRQQRLKNDEDSRNQESNKRKNNFSKERNYDSSEEKRSQSKNKEHKIQVYRHYLSQEEQFIAYSVVTKQSRSGMFLNEKLLVLHSSKRQLSYYSKFPKRLPFSSYQQIQTTFLNENRPKQTVDFDRMRRFIFVPERGSLAGIMVSYLNELGERKEWKLGMGNNTVMNEWIEMVNEVIKKEHLSIVRSQVKYPPKPKKQAQHKSNNYDTKFTKTLKQQVLPMMRQSRSPLTNKSANNSSLLTSNVKSPRNDLPTPKSGQKQYIIDKSKFINTKNYVIDLEDANSEDILYQPPTYQIVTKENEISSLEVKKLSQTQMVINNNKSDNNKEVKSTLLLAHDQTSQKSRFSQQLEKKEKIINHVHQNRVSTFIKKQLQQKQQLKSKQRENQLKSHSEIIPQSFGLSKKQSGERLSQSTHKDLNIHIDSKISFQEYEFKEDTQNGDSTTKNEHQKYFSSTDNIDEQLKSPSISPVSHSIPQPSNQLNQQRSPRKRGYTELIIERNNHQNRYSHTIERINDKTNESNLNSPQHMLSFSDQKNPIQNLQSPKINSHLTKKSSQIQDIIIGEKLNQGYILNFSPHSFSNNWFRLWLQTQPNNRIQIYTAFVKACKTIVTKLVDSPQQFPNCYHMTQNNTHIIFSIQNITFKLPFKLHLPQGLGQFITLMDFIRSEDFLGQVFKYKRQIEDQFQNYQFTLSHMTQQFTNSILSMPIYLPMCCIVKYKGITVLCKPNITSSNLKIHKISKSDFTNYQSQLSYIEESCHLSFNLTNQQSPSFDLYKIYLPSFNKSIIYMDNLTKYLPLIGNPLRKSGNHNLQLNKFYIEQYIKTGVVEEEKDVNEIDNHIKDFVLDKLAVEIDTIGDQKIGVYGKYINQKGLKSQHLGMLYKKLQQQKQSTKNQLQLSLNISLLTTEIVTNEYLKACEIFLMKEFAQQLSLSLTDFNQSSVKSNQSQLSSSYASNNTKTIKNLFQGYKGVSFGKRFSYEVIEMLGYLLCRNTKVWTVISNVIDEKYGINQFKSFFNSNPKDQITALIKKINIQEMISTFLSKINAQAEVKSWQMNQTWQSMPITQENILITPITQVKCLSLDLFNEDFTELMKQLSTNPLMLSSELYHQILQTLDISEQSYQGKSYLIKSPAYELLQLGYEKQRLTIDLCLSNCIPFYSEPPKHLTKDKHIDLYKKLSNQSQGRKSQINDTLMFQLNLNGIKWAIKHKELSLVEVLIQQQLQTMEIWQKPRHLKVKCKLFDLAAMFYHRMLGNKNNMAVQYSLKTLKLSLQNKYQFKLSQIAQKSFQSANIHFQCQEIQKSLQLYQLTQEIIYQSQKNKTLQQTDLSIEFLNIDLRKAEIKLTLGKSTQSLYSCLQCLRKCEQFQDIIANNTQSSNNYSQFEKLQLIQLHVFDVIFRCYQVTKNTEDMRRISKLCCSKFVQDKLLIMRSQFKGQSKSIDDSVSPTIMAKLIKMSWVSLVHQMLNKRLEQNNQTALQKPFVPLPQTIKSFCLSGAVSQHIKTSGERAYKVLEDVKEKLLALCRLYPRNRYDNQTLTSFICKEIVQNSARINIKKKVSRGEYELIGGNNLRMQQLNNRMEYMIKTSIKQHEYSLSVLYQLLSEVFVELSQNEQNNHPTPRKSNRFAPSVSFSEQQRPRSRQIKRSSAERQSYAPTTTKNSMLRFYQSHTQNQQSILPFALQPNQFQPELSISYKNKIDYYNEKDFGIGNRENAYSLKDQMDKKYMLVEALFGLCGREFVLGFLDETIEREKLKYYKTKDNPQSFKATIFYD